MSHNKSPNGLLKFLFGNSLFLIGGTAIALIWANVDASRNTQSHRDVFHQDLLALVGWSSEHDESHDTHSASPDSEASGEQHHESSVVADPHAAVATHPTLPDSHDEANKHTDAHAGALPVAHEESKEHGSHHAFSLYFLINDVLMAIFFAIAGKEVWESMLPGGALANPRKAAVPLLATAGGVFGPAFVYIAGVLMFSSWDDLGNGWAVPCATDIAFSYLVARAVFGVGHPAIAFLLLLAIADDAAGLVILAAFYPDPSMPVQPLWLLLSAASVGLGLGFRKLGLQSFWWYVLIPGVASWVSFYQAGIHPALGLVPIIPTLPHAHSDLGIFANKELERHDTLSRFEHFFKNPTEVILGLFGLSQAAVAFSAVDTGTWLVLAGLLIGKPVGITLMTLLADKVFKLQLPAGMSYRHIVTLGCAAGIGFTVALFMASAAFRDPGAIQDSVKMGALGSFAAAALTVAMAKVLGVVPYRNGKEQPSSASAGMGNALSFLWGRKKSHGAM